MTRDHNGWWWIMGAAVLTGLASNLEMVDALIPMIYHTQVHAAINLTSMVVGIIAGVARMSPLPISPEGRREAILDKANTLDRATVAALDASEKVDKAVGANIEAAAAAEQAKDLTQKAADK